MSNQDTQASTAAGQVTAAHQNELALSIAKDKQLSTEQTQFMGDVLELGKHAGRVQAAQVISKLADVIQVGQLRAIKERSKAAGFTWKQTCEIIGVSTKYADQILRLADSLGDSFVADASAIGVSIRALEQARKLPEDTRQRLISGGVVELEEATKEQLTEAIRELAFEHGKEQAETEAALKKETKAKERAEDKAKVLADENEALREGLPAEDRQALEQLLEQERASVAWLVRIKNTLNLAGRDPHFVARLVNHLELIARLAEVTANTVTARAQGLEPNAEALNQEVGQLNEMLAKADNRAPHPGV